MDSHRAPSLPQINGDLMLDVFTHRSLRPTPVGDYAGSARLAVIGDKMLQMAVALCSFSHRPVLSAEELEVRVDILCDERIEEFVQIYGLWDKLRRPHDIDNANSTETAEEKRFLFNSYFGAVYLQTNSVSPIVEFMSRAISPDAEPPSVSGASTSAGPISPVANRHSPSPQSSPVQSDAQPQPPPYAPPPLPSHAAPASPPLPSSFTVLALLNQTAIGMGMHIEYPARSEGPPHMPRWTVRCLINGVEKGAGVGRNQKTAKEEAAKQAFQAMGWGAGVSTVPPAVRTIDVCQIPRSSICMLRLLSWYATRGLLVGTNGT
ncbi:hypothetical protein PLICRDRAFT_50990 [Plicaturopsis crispa FD-325 SS-3]|nr:hypothetical protein PLICRDRAFT_50990 [Plicaturopsis crispa FD-325 SS-3]